MRFFNIKNILPQAFGGGGAVDYKGLDISQFVPGSQVYAYDISECVIATNEDWQGNHPDVIELTQAEYETKATELRAAYPEPEPDKVEQLEFQFAEATQAITELSILIGGMM